MLIVFDIGGTNTRIAASKDGKTLGAATIYPTPKLFQDGIEQFVATAQSVANNEPITAIAGGIPGPMNTEKTMLVTAPNLPDWNNKPLKEVLEQRLHTTVYLENDTAMWGLGEAATGSGKGKDIVVYVTVSTGVGGTRIVNGNIDASAYGFEPGHQTIDASIDAPLCGCGGSGHLEAWVGGSSIEKRYGIAPKDITDAEVWETTARMLAIGLLNTSVLWSPNVIILGGSMMKSISLERVRTHMEELNYILPQLPFITVSTLGDSGGLVGSLQYLAHAS